MSLGLFVDECRFIAVYFMLVMLDGMYPLIYDKCLFWLIPISSRILLGILKYNIYTYFYFVKTYIFAVTLMYFCQLS